MKFNILYSTPPGGIDDYILAESGVDVHIGASPNSILMDARVTQTLFNAMWDSGIRRYAHPKISRTPHTGRTVTINGRPVSDWLSPDPRMNKGGDYECAIAYLARVNPEAAALIPDACEDTKRDGFWLSRRAQERGALVFKVQAPKVLQENGITEVNAYPISLLRERFGA